MNTPPRLAAWLLESSLTVSERDAILGDLAEEFSSHVFPERGRRRAVWWYRSQVIRSVAPLLMRAWERASLRRASTAIVLAAVVTLAPAMLLLMLRTFVLQQVPLKTTAEVSAAFALTLGSVVLVAGTVGLSAAIQILTTDTRQR